VAVLPWWGRKMRSDSESTKCTQSKYEGSVFNLDLEKLCTGGRGKSDVVGVSKSIALEHFWKIVGYRRCSSGLELSYGARQCLAESESQLGGLASSMH
jgi:hypothetical protein